MKCLSCGRDSKYSERTSGHCPGCHKPFAFEPKRGDPLTDGAFANAIEAVSAAGKIRWTPDHLYYEVCRRQRWKLLSAKNIVILAAAAVLVFGFVSSRQGYTAGLLVAGALGIALGALALTKREMARIVAMKRHAFDELWARWLRAHGTPDGLIERRNPPPRSAKHAPESDLFDYSFDRAVICDRPSTVDTLLANNFHFENNCAVLAIEGYPEEVFEMVRQMLRKNPKLEVYALHDATPAGCRLAYRLKHENDWFAGTTATVVDVGLRPGQAPLFAGLLLPAASGTVPASGAITAKEARWLSSWHLELAAIRPEQTLKRLYRAINRQVDAGDSGSAGDGGVYSDSSSFSTDADDSEGGADGFG